MKSWLILLMLIVVSMANSSWASSSFVVKDIKIEGLERIGVGTVLNYLPVNVGDEVDNRRATSALRELFKTGFFDDIRFDRQDGVLVITVKERPSIDSVDTEGNEDIGDEDMQTALEEIGLSVGKVFDRSVLERVKRELERLYFSQGKYSVKITSTVTPLPRNRVAIKIDISEGDVAKIFQIKIIGNEAFPDDTLLSRFQSATPSFFSSFSSSDQYSNLKLAGDLEALRSYYLDRGYINFVVDSTQVSITPDKKDVYITVNVTEGDFYRINDVKLSGRFVVPKEELDALVTIKQGDVFSRRVTSEITNKISDRLGDDGYAFARVNTIPTINEEDKTVDLNFVIDPGDRVYVRRINITGNEKTEDAVVRRELRQLEGAWLSNAKIRRSRVRLQRLGYFESIDIDTPLVPGTTDLVDVNVSVVERASGNLTFAVGFSPDGGVSLNGSVNIDNFLGSGKTVTASVTNDRINTIYSFRYRNPYHTLDGISRGFEIFFRKRDASEANSAPFIDNRFGGNVEYRFPLTEFNSARFSFGFERLAIETTESTPTSYEQYLKDTRGFDPDNDDDVPYDVLNFSTSWVYDSTDFAFFPENGLLQRFTLEGTVPGSEVEFYKVSSRSRYYHPLFARTVLALKLEVAHGDGYGDSDVLPFFEHYFVGGPHSIRGFRSSTIGDIDKGTKDPDTEDALGGAFRTVGNVELVFPFPFIEEDKRTFRLKAFWDIGNVYTDLDEFSQSRLRQSAGLAAVWMSPLGPLTFNWARTLNDRPEDERQFFQFTLGSIF